MNACGIQLAKLTLEYFFLYKCLQCSPLRVKYGKSFEEYLNECVKGNIGVINIICRSFSVSSNLLHERLMPNRANIEMPKGVTGRNISKTKLGTFRKLYKLATKTLTKLVGRIHDI